LLKTVVQLAPGNAIQFATPRKLPESAAAKLSFCAHVRLPQLRLAGGAAGATAAPSGMAWARPNECGLAAPLGALCFAFEDKDLNQYFALASAEQVSGAGSEVFAAATTQELAKVAERGGRLR
jgi:hypothetical protein